MFRSITRFIRAADGILPGCTVYLTGSVVLDDYRDGWSDIDLLFLAPEDGMSEDRADALLNLRQKMQDAEPGNPYYRKIEGAVVPVNGFFRREECTVVTWGTTGQRLQNGYTPDAFLMASHRNWKLMLGDDIREYFIRPSRQQLKDAVRKHWETIQDHGISTKNPMYRCGWMLDIARCLYTLKTNGIISKTAAGETALRNGWCPCEDALRDALDVRKNPKTVSRDIPDEAILQFNAVLEEELARPVTVLPCYCGHDCGRCLVCHGKTEQMQAVYREKMGIEISAEDLVCCTGRSETVMKLCHDCPMRKCCREKGLEFCMDCPEPCRTYLDYEQKYVNKFGQTNL